MITRKWGPKGYSSSERISNSRVDWPGLSMFSVPHLFMGSIGSVQAQQDIGPSRSATLAIGRLLQGYVDDRSWKVIVGHERGLVTHFFSSVFR